MKYLNTRNGTEVVSFGQATLNGLGTKGGLYVPETIPLLPESFFANVEHMGDVEIGTTVMLPFVEGSLTASELEQVVNETLSFPIPVKAIGGNIHVLELFHGPTQAFKDVGARFMSRCLSRFVSQESETTVLVATSGDTGSAVANGFAGVKGIKVNILFPKGKVSPYQEYQMTSLGGNIQALEVDGSFDDCQALVKQAFSDIELNKQLQLSSANSINVARFLPQMIYYFLAYKQLKSKLGARKWLVSVPSGNFGNLTAGLIAKRMGLPIHRFIAANNSNSSFYDYLSTGKYMPRKSVSTYSNAMDVGAPSNFERIQFMYHADLNATRKDILGFSLSDEETLQVMKQVYAEYGYVLDPHGAVGHAGLKAHIRANELGVFLETAHPQKFETVVKMAVPSYPVNEVDLTGCSKISIPNSYAELIKIILS